MRAYLLSMCLLSLLGASFAAAEDFAAERRLLVEREIAPYVSDRRVLDAMLEVRREEFVPPSLRHRAYRNSPLPIGEGQTISQPLVVAMMSEALALKGHEKVLEIGTGSGYQAAVLAELADRVYSIEIIEALAASAVENLRRAGYGKVNVRSGDGYAGWSEEAPFDAIVITAAAPRIPEPLVSQLELGGRLVLPIVRDGRQFLEVHVKTSSGTSVESLGEVRFVPMTGTVRDSRKSSH